MMDRIELERALAIAGNLVRSLEELAFEKRISNKIALLEYLDSASQQNAVVKLAREMDM